ncbi:hypothetical protein JL09_g5981 [Pichia kudriavzevii]|uniref:Uncharacterized protein n=1 Tax=Pichia kudriavzevii TaxID=4909 RepID=A0A099NQR7_PICKU|nr:hypothetical protein JL09_g5981 [Pichia kudriavzevii]
MSSSNQPVAVMVKLAPRSGGFGDRSTLRNFRDWWVVMSQFSIGESPGIGLVIGNAARKGSSRCVTKVDVVGPYQMKVLNSIAFVEYVPN